MPATSTPNAPAIRIARPDDARGMGSVHARSQHATYRGIVSDVVLAEVTVEERTRWWTRALSSHDDRWLDLVAETGNEIVGFSCTGPTGLGAGGNLAAYDVYALYVAPHWERQGVGTRLLERTFAWLSARSIPDVQVLCLADTPAHRFYECAGGRRVEEAQHADRDGTMLRHMVYVYDLGEASSRSRFPTA